MKKQRRADRKFWILIAGIMIAAVICLGSALNYGDGRGGSLDGMVWKQTDDGTYEMECFRLGMKAGQYGLSVSYDSGAVRSYRVVDMQQDNGENELGKEIVSGTFPKGSSDLSISFELPENAGGLALYLESSSDAAGSGSWYLETQSGAYPDFLLAFLCITAGLIFLYRFCDWEKYSGVIVAVTAAVILTLPYFTGYQQTGDDMDFHMARIRGIAGALSSGQFPVRLNTDFAWGYGFSSSMMYPELFLYIPAVLYMLGVSLIGAYKFLILCINIATACLGLYSFKHLLRSDKLGLIVTLLYLTNPYRLENVLHRAAVGEMLAQIFLPLLLYGIYELIFGNAKKWWVAAIAATGIIQSHILSVEMSLIFVIAALVGGAVYIARNSWKERMISMVKAAVTVIGINLWFLIPFLDHFGDSNLIQDDIRSLQASSVDIYALFRMSVEFQPSYENAGVTREAFISIGPVVLLGSIVFLYYAFARKSLKERLKKIGTVCMCAGIFSCFMATRAFPWSFIQAHMGGLYEIISKIQFSWRFLAYGSLFLSVTTGIAIAELLKEKREAIAAVLAGMAVIMAFSCMDLYEKKEIFISSRSEVKNYGWGWFDYYASDASAEEILTQGDTVRTDGEVSITGYERNGVELSFDYSGVTEECTLRLPIYDYDMHQIYLDGELIRPAASENHQLTVELTAEEPEGHIDVRYYEPLIYRIGSIVSLISIVLWAVAGIRKRRRES